MPHPPEEETGVHIGDIEDGIHDATIAGRDVNQTFVDHPTGSVTQNFSTTLQIGSLKISMWIAGLFFIGLFSIIAIPVYLLGGANQPATVPTVLPSPTVATATPSFTATPTPMSMATRVPMTTKFDLYNVAIAEFGQLNAQGNIQESAEAKQYSIFLAQKLSDDFAAAEAVPFGNSTFEFAIRHDDMQTQLPGDRPIGVISNPAQAEQIRSELNADLLIYGHLTADQPAKLDLDFVYAAKQLETEPDVKSYQHLGAPIVLENVGQNQAKDVFNNNPDLAVREELIIWLAHGLALELAGGPNAYRSALDTFLRTAKSLPAGDSQDGREVLYYFQGREALAMHNLPLAESAFLTATQINPDYAIAYIGLGKVYLQRVQISLLGPQKSTADITACTTSAFSMPQLQSTETTPITITEAITTINLAIANFQLAITKTQDSTEPLIPAVATVMLGAAYRFRSLAYTQVEQLDKANDDLNLATTELTATIPIFTDTQQYGFLAYAHYLLGESYRQQAYLDIKQQDQAKAQDHYLRAHDDYARCYQLKATFNPDHATPWQTTIGCLCGLWDDRLRMDWPKVGGGNG